MLKYTPGLLLVPNAKLSGVEMRSVSASGGGPQARNVLERFVIIRVTHALNAQEPQIPTD